MNKTEGLTVVGDQLLLQNRTPGYYMKSLCATIGKYSGNKFMKDADFQQINRFKC